MIGTYMKKKTARKISLAIIFGGRSAEHDVSLVSARNIVNAVNKKKYTIIPIFIDRRGRWFLVKEKDLMCGCKFLEEQKVPITWRMQEDLFVLHNGKSNRVIDVVFPVLHGPFGEDGTIQGLLKLYNIPFVGPCVLGSAIGMDKDVSKRLLREAGLPVVDFLVFKSHQKKEIDFDKIVKCLSLPFFIKPANLGSSVGVSKINNQKEFLRAVRVAFSYDRKIIMEKYIAGKEVECSVMGNQDPIASVPGEIIPSHDFYSYEAKYIDENGATIAIPAHIPVSVRKKVQDLALRTFETLCCEGMGRVDFFVTQKNEIYINEINTIPGFTSISMYPKLWEKSGVSYAKLIDLLIAYAVDRHKKEKKLKTVK